MRFPPEMEKRILAELRNDREQCIRFPADAYRSDGRILIHRDGLSQLLHRYLFNKLHPRNPIRRGEFLLLRIQDDHGERPCQNPYHYERSTTSQRILERKPRKRYPKKPTGRPSYAQQNAAKTHCPHGHEFTPENTYEWVDAKGRTHRKCRRCTLARTARQHQIERQKETS